MKIAVGSTNPVKIEAVRLAFEKVWPDESWIVEGVEVKSGVSDQPMSDEESIRGATNRAKKARAKLNAEYGVGLEGGLHKIGKLWFDAGWIVIINQKGQIGYGSSVRANTPKKMINKVKKGMELGLVDDLFFNLKNSKQNEGHFGLITKNAITRTLGYRDGVIMALARFIHPDLFE